MAASGGREWGARECAKPLRAYDQSHRLQPQALAALTRFLDDGRLCMTNNAAERELRAIAVGRRNWTFAGSDEGGRRAAALYTLIATAKLNDVDPQAWLADVWHACWITRRNGSATCCRGTGTRNAEPPPDTG